MIAFRDPGTEGLSRWHASDGNPAARRIAEAARRRSIAGRALACRRSIRPVAAQDLDRDGDRWLSLSPPPVSAFHLRNSNEIGAQAPAAATFVGSETCAGCHQAEAKLWDASQHKAAMAHATDKTVLGDFNDASFDYYGVHSRFFRRDGKFFVETDGPDGKLATFEVKYTFGVDPLQQYLVEFPDGRLQALSLAWDSRPKDERRPALVSPLSRRGDQARRRPALDQAEPELEFHVRGVPFDRPAQELRRQNRSLRHHAGRKSAWVARPVMARARAHAAWARDQQSWWPFGKREDASKGLLVRFDERRGVTWPIDPQTGTSRRSAAPAALAQGGRDLRAVPRAPRRF